MTGDGIGCHDDNVPDVGVRPVLRGILKDVQGSIQDLGAFADEQETTRHPERAGSNVRDTAHHVTLQDHDPMNLGRELEAGAEQGVHTEVGLQERDAVHRSQEEGKACAKHRAAALLDLLQLEAGLQDHGRPCRMRVEGSLGTDERVADSQATGQRNLQEIILLEPAFLEQLAHARVHLFGYEGGSGHMHLFEILTRNRLAAGSTAALEQYR